MSDTKAVPKMTDLHAAVVFERSQFRGQEPFSEKCLDEIHALVRSLVSGEQVVVSRAELEAIKRELMLVSGEAYQSTGPNLVWEALRSPVNRVMRWLTPPSDGGQP
jgi:hypothetical protein